LPVLRLLLVWLVVILSSVGAMAANQDWKPRPENLTGIDGVGIRCIVSSDREFVHKMCKTLIEAGMEKASAAGIKAASSGITWERNPDEAHLAATRSAEIDNPLLLEFFIRGTDGDPVSGAIHILASVEYSGAIEQGSDQPPRAGRLLIWENAGTASGPVKLVPDALAAHMAKKLDLLFEEFGK